MIYNGYYGPAWIGGNDAVRVMCKHHVTDIDPRVCITEQILVAECSVNSERICTIGIPGMSRSFVNSDLIS